MAARPEVVEDAEDAWFELDWLIANEPDIGWEVLIALARRCNDEDAWATLAVGRWIRSFTLTAGRSRLASMRS